MDYELIIHQIISHMWLTSLVMNKIYPSIHSQAPCFIPRKIKDVVKPEQNIYLFSFSQRSIVSVSGIKENFNLN
jgi:hypothetical protein